MKKYCVVFETPEGIAKYKEDQNEINKFFRSEYFFNSTVLIIFLKKTKGYPLFQRYFDAFGKAKVYTFKYRRDEIKLFTNPILYHIADNNKYCQEYMQNERK